MAKPLHFYGPLPQSLTVKGANQVFDYSRMMGRFFEPEDRICIIIDNCNYDELRKIPEFSKKVNRYGDVVERDEGYGFELKYPDMPRARKWADEF